MKDQISALQEQASIVEGERDELQRHLDMLMKNMRDYRIRYSS